MANAFSLFGELRVDTKGFETALTRSTASLKQTEAELNKTEQAAKRTGSAMATMGKSMSSAGSTIRNVGSSLAMGLTAPLLAAGYAFVSSATSIDAMRNKLIAATGSIDAANKKMVELRNLAQSNAGVFTKGAVDMYAFLRPMKIGESTIGNMIKAMGRLKLANEEIDLNRTALNLTQLFTQGFERPDLKELVGAFPRFGEIMQEAFKLSGTDLDTISTEMKAKLAAGMSKSDFFGAVADALNNDPSLSKLSDTIGIRFQKMMERVFIAFEPLGNKILSILEPIAASVTPVIEQLGAAFGQLTQPAQAAILVFAGIAAAIGPVLIGIGAVVSAVGAIATGIGAVGGLSVVVPVIAAIGVGIAQLVAVGAALYAAWTTNFGGIRDLVAQVGEAVSAAWGQMSANLMELTTTVGGEMSKFWAENGKDIIAAVTKISEGVKSAWQIVAKFWAENGANISAITQSVWGVVKGIVIGTIQVIGTAIKLVAAVINGDWSKAWDALKGIVVAAMNATAAVVRGAGAMVVGSLKVALNAVWALSGWLLTQAASLGKSLVQGFINGIISMAGQALSAARSVFAPVIGVAKQIFDSHSPSKVFFAIGKDVAQGFIDGLAAMKTGVYAAMAGMLDITKIKGLGKKDAPGVEYLTSLIRELDALTPRTRLQATVAELTASKYAGMNKELREMILNLARKRDAMDAATESLKRYTEFIGDIDKGDPRDQGSGVGQGGTSGSLGGNLFGPNFGKDRAWNSDEGPMAPPRTTWENFWDMMALRMGQFQSSLPSMKEAIGENLIGGIMELGNVFATAISGWIENGENFFKAIAKGFRQMVANIIGELVRLMAFKLLMKVFGIAAGGFGSAASGVSGALSSGLGGIGSGVAGGVASLGGGLASLGGSIGGMAMGGMMPAFAGNAGPSNTTTTNAPVFNINVSGGGNSQDTVRSVKQGIREATRMQQREEWRRK